MYGKIFESIFKSTLVSEGGWLPTYIFMSMITLADKDGIVDFAPNALYRHLGFKTYDSKVTLDDFQEALVYLESPDPESNSPNEDGKRIIPLREIDQVKGNRGWLVVNYLDYRKKASSCEPPGASTERVRKFRERQKKRDMKRDVTNCNGHTDTDTDTDTDIKKKINKRKTTWPEVFPITDQMRQYAAHKKHYPDLDDLTEAFLIHHRKKGSVFVDWYAAWQQWFRNDIKFHGPADTRPMEERYK